MQRKTYLERCKTVGRLGPVRTELDRSSAYGEFIFGHESAKKNQADPSATLLEMDGQPTLALDIEAVSSFVSIRANTAVFRDCFYYEATVMTDGLMQIGWCSLMTNFNSHDGVGDS